MLERARLDAGLAVAFVVSGTAALMLEVVWNRQLHLVFGGSAVATSAVLAAYMGGLALGSLLLAPWVRARFHPALAYAGMELLIAAYALVVPTLMDAVGPLQDALHAGGGMSLQGAAVRFALTGGVLLVPTVLMGATLPCLADLARQGDEGASRVGLLYAANTLGAVLGTLLATFVAFPTLGLWGTNRAAAALDVVAAAVALGLWFRLGRPGPVTREAVSTPASRASSMVWPLWAYGVSGAVAMALEVCWARGLSMVLGSSIHAFSLMLAAFLLGLTVGARAATSAWAVRLNARVALGVALAFSAGAGFVGTWLLDELPWVMWWTARARDLSHLHIWGATFACAVLVMLPAALGFGAVLPLALRAAGQDETGSSLGDLVGRAYAINTTGAIVGSLAAGFLLIPWLGLDRAAHLLCALLAGVGALVLLRAAPRAALGVVVGMALTAGWDGFDVSQWSAGAFRVYLSRSVWKDGLPHGDVIFRRDGLSTTVTVEESDGRVSLKVNGKTDASSEGDMPTQVLSGLLPAMLHPDPKRAVIIGFGSGVTSDALLSYPGLESQEMVELEPAVVEAGAFFFMVNHRPWEDPRYVGVFDDGRHHLTREGAPYDLIISEPSNPWITGASNLFTQEFWMLARRRLAPGGVFLQWVQLYEMSEDRIRSLMGTFRSVFPHVMVFGAHPESNDTFMVGSDSPLVLDEALVRRRWEIPSVRRNLIRADVTTPLDLTALVLMDEPALDAFVAGHIPNTDNNMHVELNAPKDLVAYASKEAELPFLRPLAGKRLPLVERAVRFQPGWDVRTRNLALAEVMFRGGLMEDARALLATLVGQGEPWESGRARLLAALEVLEGDDNMPVVLQEAPDPPDARYSRAIQFMVEGSDRKALESLEPFAGFEKRSRAHRFLYAYLLYRAEWRYRAMDVIQPLLFDHPWRRAHPQVMYYAARILWLQDENQRAGRLALEVVDLQHPQWALASGVTSDPSAH